MDRPEGDLQAILLGQGCQKGVAVIMKTDNLFCPEGGQVIDKPLRFFLHRAWFSEMEVPDSAEIVGTFDDRQILEEWIVQEFTHHISDDTEIQHWLALFALLDNCRQTVKFGEILHGLFGDPQRARLFLTLVEQVKGIGLGGVSPATSSFISFCARSRS